MRDETPKVNMKRTSTAKKRQSNAHEEPYKLSMGNEGGLTYSYNAVSPDDFDSPNYPYGTRLTEVPLIPFDSTYKVTFKLTIELQEGQEVFILGSLPELGNWQSYMCPMVQT